MVSRQRYKCPILRRGRKLGDVKKNAAASQDRDGWFAPCI